MADPLSMSLEDIIKTNKKSGSANPRGGARTRASGPGPARRIPNRGLNRSAPYSAAPSRAPETSWQHDMFVDQGSAFGAAQPGRASAIETGTKLYISNLDYGVSNEDVKELFAEEGDLKRFSIHYDRSGRSKGTAEVVYSRRADAVAAVKRYNNVQLDGKPMKIEIVGTNIVTPALPMAMPPLLPFNPPPYVNPNGFQRGGQGRGGFQGRPRGGGGGVGGGRGRGRGGRGRGRGGRGETEKVSADDLDADLEKYHSEAMQET